MTNCPHCRQPVYGMPAHPCCQAEMGEQGRSFCEPCEVSRMTEHERRSWARQQAAASWF